MSTDHGNVRVPYSQELADWISSIRAHEAKDGRDEERQIWYFPTDRVREEYLQSIDTEVEQDLDVVLRNLLIPSSALGLDYSNLEIYRTAKDQEPEHAQARMIVANFERSPHFRRVLRYFSGATDQLPWEGITWVRYLLPHNPRVALQAIEAYLSAHSVFMSDHMIYALSDAEALIRSRYIGVPASSEARRQILLGLTSRQFEQLVSHLYAEKGYATHLTPPTRDGGRDIEANMEGSGQREYLLIECKRYIKPVGVSLVRELLGTLSNERRTKGVLVTSSRFTAGARKLADQNFRIELISGLELVVLLNEFLGWSWPGRIEYFTRSSD
jgi:restriction system protein